MMTAVWETAEVRGAALLILLALADYANDNGICWPSVETLARKARVSERQTHRLLRGLVKSGAVKIEVRAGPKGVNLYTLQLGDNLTPPGDISSQGVPSDTPGGLNW
jgi:hypothetical protein